MKITQKMLEKKLSLMTNLTLGDSHRAIEALKSIITEELQRNNNVLLTGFGQFSTFTRYARGGVNPQHPHERIIIPEVRIPKFKSGSTLKKAIKNYDRL